MIWRIRSRRVFDELRRCGARVRSGPVRLSHVDIVTDHPQVAFAFGRRFGSAVERNRARRRLGAAFAAAWDEDRYRPGAFQLTGSRQLLTAPFATVVESVERCLAEVAPSGVGGRQSSVQSGGRNR